MRDLTFWIVAGEESGDSRAAEVFRSLRAERPSARFHGAGGNALAALCEPPYDNWAHEAGVTGLWDVVKRYGYFRAKFQAMRRDIATKRPDAVVLVDYPGFNLRLAKALRQDGYGGKILYYISPQVWAWNRARIPRMARWLDLMICVFPFEAPMYEASGLRTVFVGHPLLEALRAEKRTIHREGDLIGLFPGSRDREVRRLFPAMVQASVILRATHPDLRFEAAAANPARAAQMQSLAAGFGITVRTGIAHDLMQRASAGLICSGTATLEAAFFGLPHAILYKTAWLTFEVGRRLVDVNALGIINILNNYRKNPPVDPKLPAAPAPHVVHELIQHEATPAALASEIRRLIQDDQTPLLESLATLVGGLQAEGAARRAAHQILQALP